MSLILGVDTGGTFTDAALLDAESGAVKARAQGAHHPRGPRRRDRGRAEWAAHRRLAAGGIERPCPPRWPRMPPWRDWGSRVGCILIGYDPGVMRHYRLDATFARPRVAHVAGRHDIFGEEVTPFDEDGLRDAVDRLAPEVDALAISSYLAPRNPDHERRAVRLARERTSLPVVAGGALSSQINSIRRGTTATLNAKLLTVTSELLQHAGTCGPATRREPGANGCPRATRR